MIVSQDEWIMLEPAALIPMNQIAMKMQTSCTSVLMWNQMLTDRAVTKRILHRRQIGDVK